MLRNKLTTLMLGLSWAAAACNNTGFTSDSGKRDAVAKPTPTPQTTQQAVTNQNLQFTCAGGANNQAHLQVKGQQTTMVSLQGQFCGVSQTPTNDPLTILFIIDYSGSMRDNDPSLLLTCGRLQAAQTIVNSLQAAATANQNIRFAIQPFGSDAMTPVNPTSLSSFQSNMNAGSFCRNDGGSTNYEAVFKAAQTMLQPIQGKKVIYFISDGLPTKSQTIEFGGTPGETTDQKNQDMQQITSAGLAAATSLRTSVADLTFDAIFLGTGPDPTLAGIQTVDPQTYLGQIAGSPSNVRVVTSANDLATQIATFQPPPAGPLDATTVQGSVTAPGFGAQPIKLASLSEVPGQTGVWQFVTEPFQLDGNPNGVVGNDVEITVRSADGKTYQASALIDFVIDSSASTH